MAMFTSINSILFATNLSPACRPALEASVSMAAHYRAKLVLLHVITSEMPNYLESHFKGVLGSSEWESLKQEHEQDAREALIGKMSPGKIGQRAIRKYCEDAGIDPELFEFTWQDAVVEDKHIVRAILNQSKEYDSNLIVIGAQKGRFGGNATGSTIKGVLEKSAIPVLVVPPRREK